MRTYDLKVGYSCNNRCKHCVVDGMKRHLVDRGLDIDLSTQECINLIQEQCRNGIERIVLTGGEITIRKDFEKIIDECIKQNLEISIQSNGRMFKEDIIANIAAKPSSIDFAIALHGCNAMTHDAVTGIKGSFKETCSGVKKLSERNLPVTIKVVMSKYNQKELPEIVTLAKTLGAYNINFAFPHALGAAQENFGTVVPTYTSLVKDITRTIDKASGYGIPIDFETIPFCIIPNHIDLISELCYQRDEVFCTQTREETYHWNSVRKKIKKKNEICKGCYFNQWCEGVWEEYFDHFGGDELIPMKYDSRYEELLQKAKMRYA